MSAFYKSLLLSLTALFICSPSLAATGDLIEKKTFEISKDSVWAAERQTLQTARQRCMDIQNQDPEDCLAESMEDLRATADAVAFVRNFGKGAYVRKFRETGKVDLAYIAYPFRANENYGCLIVNGEPPTIDVDDISKLPKENMDLDKNYQTIKKAFPKVTLWPGDRFHTQYPLVETSTDGGRTFIVPYHLKNFCRVCETLGTAFFAFDFDKKGQFAGVRFLRVELPVKKTQNKEEARKESEQVRFVIMTEEDKEFTVRLSSNRTTGYQWHLGEPVDERIVKLARSEYIVFEPGLPGSEGEEIWTFLATGKGETEILMEYSRPWEKNTHPIKTATIKVSVRQGSR